MPPWAGARRPKSFWERILRKPLGRLAAAVLAGAVITIGMAPAALADDASTTAAPTSSVPETTTTQSEPVTATTDAPSDVPTTTSSVDPTPTSSSVPTTTSSPGGTTTSVKPTTSKPSETTTEPTTTTPEEPPYEDNVGYGIDFGDGTGVLVIACAAGEPRNVTSPDFDVIDGPYQDEQDGRYWEYLVELHGGKTFASGTVVADWECGSLPEGGGASGGGVPVPPVPGSDQAAAWQQSNGSDAQVSFAPRAGVETGFGGTAGN